MGIYQILYQTTPGGPLIIGVGVSKTSEVNATAFVVGLNTITYYRSLKKAYNYVYFSNLLGTTHYAQSHKVFFNANINY